MGDCFAGRLTPASLAMTCSEILWLNCYGGSMAQSDPDFVAFLKAYPSYPTTHIIDDLRSVEYARLDVGGHIYLDYTLSRNYVDTINCLPSMSSAIRIRSIPPPSRQRSLWSMPVNTY